MTTTRQWRERRAEIVEDFEREIYGRVPRNVPRVTWSVTASDSGSVGGRRVVGKQLTGHVDNSAYPAIDVDIQMTLVTPKDAKKPVPVMMMFGGGRLGLRVDQSGQRPGRQRRGIDARGHRPREQGPAAEA